MDASRDGTPLTVIIPSSGRWGTLARTLDALAAQTAGGFSTIVVIDGLDRPVPADLHQRPGVRVLAQPEQGPGPARNLALDLADRELVLLLGDDTIPVPDLVERHLRRHRAEPAAETAVLGRVRWHPEVAGRRINRWLDWSGFQFDYAALDAEYAAGEIDPQQGWRTIDAGFARFYAANVSLKRAFLERFDPQFRFGYEDMDLGRRQADRGMVLRYEPRAVGLHLHAHTLEGLRARFNQVGEAEALMAAKHPGFEPHFQPRFRAAREQEPVSAVWPRIHDHVPHALERVWWPVHARAERWYLQELADSFLEGWERAQARLARSAASSEPTAAGGSAAGAEPSSSGGS